MNDMDDFNEIYEKSDESYELYGKYNDAPSFNKIRIDLLEKELKELEEVASEENKKERLEKMRDLYKLYKTENMSKEERAIIKKGKALAGIEPEKKPAKKAKRKTLSPEARAWRARQEHLYK